MWGVAVYRDTGRIAYMGEREDKARLNESCIWLDTGPAAVVDIGLVRWNGTAWETDEALVAERARSEVRDQLAASDRHMARVTEDLIDWMVAWGRLELGELPGAVREKLGERKRLRERL